MHVTVLTLFPEYFTRPLAQSITGRARRRGLFSYETVDLRDYVGEDGTVDDYRRIVAVNVDGVVFGIQGLAPRMQPGSAFVVTASLAGLIPMASDPLYVLTKHAVVGYARSMAEVLEPRGIRVNVVCPGIVRTPMTAPKQADFDAAGFPLMEPEQIADAVLVAARSELTGQAWVCQPGREPLLFRFPNVPGPRVEGAEGMVPQL